MTMIIDGSTGLEFPDGSDQTTAFTSNSPTFTGTVSVAALTASGNLTFSSTGQRILGDFSNATPSNQVIWQTSTVNANTTLQVMPNGTGVQSNLLLRNASDLTNNSFANFRINATELGILSSATGTGTFLPLTMYTGGSERLRIDTSGNVGIGTSSITPRDAGARVLEIYGGTDGRSSIKMTNSTSGTGATDGMFIGYDANLDFIALNTEAGNLRLGTSNTERMRITAAGGVAFGGASNFGSSGQVLQSNGDAAPTWVTASSIGVGQSWTNVGGSRSSGTTYTNSTGRAIQLMVATDNTGNTTYGSAGSAKFFINGNNVGESFCSNAANIGGLFQAIIPNGATYQVSASTIRSWWELR